MNRRKQHKLAAVKSLRRRSGRVGLGCAAFFLLVFLSALLGLSFLYTNLVADLPSLAVIPGMFDPASGSLMQPTRLYDRSGQQLLMSLENPGISRRYLSVNPNQPNHFSPELLRVTVGALEPRFWNSPGFSLSHLTDPEAITIAERLVDDLLLWKEPGGVRHALRMRVLAAQIIAQYGHVQVLEWYLNSTYYGHLAFGSDSAARLYLGRTAANMDLAGAALLVAANQAPGLNPLDDPAAAIERQHAVLDKLLALKVITSDEHSRALAEKLQLVQPIGEEASPAAAFSRLVLSNLSERFGRERIERGGLRVITTLDYNLQLELFCLTRTQLARLSGKPDDFRNPDGSACASARLLPTLPPGEQPLVDAAASAVVLDPTSGQVLALLGDTTTSGETNFLNPHTPGSLLTPFVAVSGFARSLSPASLTWDVPPSQPDGTLLTGHPNPDGKYHGPVRLRIALANDYLSPQAQRMEQMGASNVWRLAGAFGLSSLADETSADLLYKGGSVSPLEFAQAYSVIASQGIRVGQRLTPGAEVSPATVLYVEDSDGTAWLDARQPESQTVVSAQLAYLIHNVLGDASARWPSLGYPNPLEIGRPSGAKIGQVESGTEVWAAGYTPQRVAVFWLGESSKAPAKLNPRMVTGMWHALMQHATRTLPAADWVEPSGIARVDVCDLSGQLPTAACPDVVSEVFLTGNEPNAADSLFRAYQINRETGRLATVFTPASLIEEKTFLVVPQEARAWAQAAQLPVPPEDFDAIQPPQDTPGLGISAPRMFDFVHGQVTIVGTAAGDGFRSYQVQVGQGLNPVNWLQVGSGSSAPVTDGTLGVWDTQGQEGLYAVRLQLVRRDQTVETATVQVTVDNTAPLVRIPYPITGQIFQLAQDRSITLQADISEDIGLQRIVWLVDGVQIGESKQSPYAITWQAVRGDHLLEVRAYDFAGNEGKSGEVKFTVQ